MLHPFRTLVVLISLAAPIVGAPSTVPEWPFDVLRLKNGVVHKGLVLEESATAVKFKVVRRAPGKPTGSVTLSFTKKEIAKLERLSDDDRAVLKAKLDDIESSPEAEARRLEKVDLKLCDWMGKKDAGLRYDSDYFSLVSDAPEEVVRRAACRLENVYTAYARFFPARFAGAAPTVVNVHQTLAGYQKSVPGGEAIKNPAFFEVSANRVVCGTDLQKLGDDLARFHAKAKVDLDKIAEGEAKVIKYYADKPDFQRFMKPFKDQRAQIEKVAKQNDNAFELATRQLFQTLYHEAFHAYACCFVFPASGNDRTKSPGELPRWLNEGMAQVFETAIFEAGELRIGHTDRGRLEKAQDALTKKEFPPLKSILTAGRVAFVVTHAGKRPEADRAYVATWALAAYLMFDRQVIGTSALDEFIKSINSGTDPIKTFEALVDQPLDEFERAFQSWLRKLVPTRPVLEIGGK